MKILEVIKVQSARQHERVQWKRNLISSYIMLWLLLLYITDKRSKKQNHAVKLSKIIPKVWSLDQQQRCHVTWDLVSTTNIYTTLDGAQQAVPLSTSGDFAVSKFGEH